VQHPSGAVLVTLSRRCCCCCNSSNILYECSTPAALHSWPAHTLAVTAVWAGAGGAHALAATASLDHSCHLYSLATGAAADSRKIARYLLRCPAWYQVQAIQLCAFRMLRPTMQGVIGLLSGSSAPVGLAAKLAGAQLRLSVTFWCVQRLGWSQTR
jgi:hypothetical protein